jgi:glycosyltransferase involved in cell wall biosynthesis
VIDQVNTFGFGVTKTKHQTACLIHQLADDVWNMEVKWPLNILGRWLEQRVLRMYIDVPFMTMCQSTIDELHAWGWRGIGMVTPTGIDDIYTVDKATVPVLSFLGRFGAKSKRLDHALEIHRRVMESYPDCELWVIGRGIAPDITMSAKNVKVFANVSDDERDEALGQAWCCIATSVREGWGRMVTESGAAGTPTVGYNVPGLRDSIRDGETGLLVPESPQAAATAIIELFHHPNKLALLGRNAQLEAAKTTWTLSIDRFEEAVTSLIQ